MLSKLMPSGLEINKYRAARLVLGCYPHLSRISNGFSTSFNVLQDITTLCHFSKAIKLKL